MRRIATPQCALAALASVILATPVAGAGQPTPTPTPIPPEYHAVTLVGAKATAVSTLRVRLPMSDAGRVAGRVDNGTVHRSGGADCPLYRGAVWSLLGVGSSTSAISPTLLPQPPASGADGLQSAGATGLSSAGGFVAGGAFREWRSSNPTSCLYDWDGVVWVNDGLGWSNPERVERCDVAGARLGFSFTPSTTVLGVNDHGLASGQCVPTTNLSGGVPVVWTRTSPGVWTMRVLDTPGYTGGYAVAVINGSGVDTDLVVGQSFGGLPGAAATLWHCSAGCWADVLPTQGGGQLNEVQRKGSVDYAARWRRVGGVWAAGEKLENLDDRTAHYNWAHSIDPDGRVLVHQDGADPVALIPVGKLVP